MESDIPMSICTQRPSRQGCRILPRSVWCVTLGLTMCICSALPSRAIAAQPAAQNRKAAVASAVDLHAKSADAYAPYQDDGEIHPWHIQGRIWLLAGEPAGSNVAVQVGDEGALIVDTGTREMAPKLLAQIRQLIQAQAGDLKRIQFVIDTNGRADHIGGNEAIRTAGDTVEAGNELIDNQGLVGGAQVIANQNVLDRLVAERTSSGSAVSQGLWPNNTEDFDLYNAHFNGEAVQLYHPHNANTDGQLMVLFRGSDVIAAGDVFDMNSYPLIDVSRGGTIDGELVALNRLTDLTVPAENQEGGTMVIPGHGRLGDQSDVVRYKNMVTVIRNRVQFYKGQSKTLAQVLALNPSADYNDRWGATTGSTTRDFLTAVYDTLPQRGPDFSMLNANLVPAPAPAAGQGSRISGFRLY